MFVGEDQGEGHQADIQVGFCYRPPSQDEAIDEMVFKQLGEVSQSLAFVFMGDFNLPYVC